MEADVAYRSAQAEYDAAEPDDGEECSYDEYPEPETWHRIDAVTLDAGRIRAYHATNDNLDRGYPTEYAEWTTTYRSLEGFRILCGVTRVGVLGCRVTVTLDGEEQHHPEEMARRARVKELAQHLADELGRLLSEYPGATYSEVVRAIGSLEPPGA